MSALLEMRGISKSYGPVHANDRHRPDVRPGRSSACSARTARARARLMKILFGMVRPDQGAIVFKDRELPATVRRAPRCAPASA